MTIELPGPWVDYGRVEAKPWLNNHGIVKLMEFPVRVAAMSRRAFHLYWQRHHSPNVMNVTAFSQFMRKYNTGHVYPEKVSGLPPRYQQTTPFEGASEVWINSLAEVSGWLGHPLYAELIRPDEPRFILQDGSGGFVVVKEERLYEPDADMVETGLTKLYLLIKRRAHLDHDAFHAAASEYGQLLLDQPSLRKALRKFVISHRLRDPLPKGMVFANIDAVAELWFGDPNGIAPFFSSSEYVSRIGPREASVFDAAELRALVAKMHVVHDEFSFQPSTMQSIPFKWENPPA